MKRESMKCIFAIAVTALTVAVACSPKTGNFDTASAEECRGAAISVLSLAAILFSGGALMFGKSKDETP